MVWVLKKNPINHQSELLHFFFFFSLQVPVIIKAAAAAAKSPQSCPTLYDPIDGSPPGSPIPRILQARTLEWVAISLSNAGKWEVRVKSLSRVWLFVTPWTAAHQAPPSMGFSRQECWSGCHRLLWSLKLASTKATMRAVSVLEFYNL